MSRVISYLPIREKVAPITEENSTFYGNIPTLTPEQEKEAKDLFNSLKVINLVNKSNIIN